MKTLSMTFTSFTWQIKITLHYIKFRVKNAEALQSHYRQFKILESK